MSQSKSRNPVAMEDRAQAGEKLFSPSAARNAGPIRNVLAPRLPPGARVLEIGCGTGEHGEAVCQARPDIMWTPSDPDPASRASASARALDLPNLQPARAINAADRDWADGLDPVDAVVCCNVIHIAPWAVAEGLAAGAARLLAPNGQVVLYGPFLTRDETAPSNLAFDASLKARNPEWGVRPLDTVTALFARHNLAREDVIAMPANNLTLVFRPEPT